MMLSNPLATTTLESMKAAKSIVLVALLIVFWCWETWRPFFGQRDGRVRHAVRNLAIALVNTLVLGAVFGATTVTVLEWTAQCRLGLMNALDLAPLMRFIAAVILLDGWMYLWHRANHTVPVLWRFHRMHHSDPHMDVTTATRFHLGEHVGSSVLRLGLIPLIGFEIENLLVYDTVLIAITQFHHADISLGRCDAWLRWLIVTPDMHKVHHSNQRPDTDSNYSTVLSAWDRLARSFRARSDPKTLQFGLPEFTDPAWQRWWGMWKTPFVRVPRSSVEPNLD